MPVIVPTGVKLSTSWVLSNPVVIVTLAPVKLALSVSVMVMVGSITLVAFSV